MAIKNTNIAIAIILNVVITVFEIIADSDRQLGSGIRSLA